MHDLRAQLAGPSADTLLSVVRSALADPSALVTEWDLSPLRGGFGTLAAESWLYVLTGTAQVGLAALPWSVVLKVLAPVVGPDDPTRIHYRRREFELYRSGLLDALPGDLRAPRRFGCDELADGSAWVWLEHVQESGPRLWPLSQWALAARHLGQFNGAYLTGRPLPRAPWLGGQRLRSWLARHEPLVARIAAAPDIPEVRQWWPRPVVDALLSLWEEREIFCAALAPLAQTFGHGDAIRRNLLAHRGTDGSEQTVAIDWEYTGYYAAGEEVGQTLSVASAFFDVEPADLPALDEALFESYVAGLVEVGWRGDSHLVRLAYTAHAALRNLFNAVGATVPDEARRAATLENQGHTWEELAERRAAIRPFLLKRAEVARGLLEAL